MVRIAICDDEQLTHDMIDQFLLSYEKNLGQKIRSVHFYTAEELLQTRERFDILMLDMGMPQMDGIEAVRILNIESTCRIIMLSDSVERFKEAFKLGAFRFLTKPVQEEDVFEAVNEVRKCMTDCQKFSVYRDGCSFQVQQRDIVYLMADNKETRIFTERYDFRSRISLKKWVTQLDERLFYNCHRGYIVNLSKIKEIDKNMIYVTTGEKIPVARRHHAGFQRAFMEFNAIRGKF